MSHGSNFINRKPLIHQSGVCFRVHLEKCATAGSHSELFRSKHRAMCVFNTVNCVSMHSIEIENVETYARHTRYSVYSEHLE